MAKTFMPKTAGASGKTVFLQARQLLAQGQENLAQQCLQQGVLLFPQDANLWLLLAQLYQQRGDAQLALDALERTQSLKPEWPELNKQFGFYYLAQQQPKAALPYFEKAMAAGMPHLLEQAALARHLLGDRAGALLAYEQAAVRGSQTAYSNAAWLRALMGLAGTPDLAKLDAPMRLFFSDDAGALLEQTQAYAQRYNPRAKVEKNPDALPQFKPRASGTPLRIGYLSADFHAHATAYLLADLFKEHARPQFHITALSYGPDDDSSMRARILAGVDEFVALRGLSLPAAQAKLAALNLDVIVDLKGYTRGAQPDLLAQRPAPVAMHWLGYPGPLALPYIDYLIADAVLIPPELACHYTEKILCLEPCYQPNSATRKPAETLSRAAYGLPENGLIFGVFCQSYKITDAMFQLWCRLLKALPDSCLWLLASVPEAEVSLRARAEALGIAPERLVFAPHLPLDEHLARFRLVDLVLDTHPYGGHTSCADALFMHTPYLTLQGQSFASRVASSLLLACNLPELITKNAQDYEQRALSLLQQPQQLLALRAKMAAGVPTSRLFAMAPLVRQLEVFYEKTYARALAGLPPVAVRLAGLPPVA